MDDKIFIQRRFRIERDGKSYDDAITLAEEEYKALTEETIEEEKEKRFAEWKQRVDNPPTQTLSDEELLDVLNQELQEVESRKFELEELIRSKTERKAE